MKGRPLVYIASAYSGDIVRNTEKAAIYCRFAVAEGKAPIAPHLFLPSFLSEETERALALKLGVAILSRCSERWAAREQGIKIRRFTEDMEELV